MLSAIRRRMTPATVIATLALLFAMSGGAYAAKKYLITSTKQISPKVLKQLKGANGKNGAVGPAGPAGAGTAGAAGPQGPAGPAGAGAKGENGASGAEGKEGKEGKIGPKGATGEPWPAGGTLPKGATETGTWLAPITTTVEGSEGIAMISFSIPLAAALDGSHVQYVTVEAVENNTRPTGCTGGTAEAPEPEEGYLCVFEGRSSFPRGGVIAASFTTTGGTPPQAGAGQTGATISLSVEGAQTGSHFLGTWGVTSKGE
jgi:hypothetical protein